MKSILFVIKMNRLIINQKEKIIMDKIIIRRKKNKLKWTAVLGFIAAILAVTVVLLVKKYRRGI